MYPTRRSLLPHFLLFTFCRRLFSPSFATLHIKPQTPPHSTSPSHDSQHWKVTHLHRPPHPRHHGIDAKERQTSADLPTLHRSSNQNLRLVQEHQLLLPRVPASRLALTQVPMQELPSLRRTPTWAVHAARRGLQLEGRQAAIRVGAFVDAGSPAERR